MWRRAAIVALLALVPGLAWAEHEPAFPHPTPGEMAEAMLPCMPEDTLRPIWAAKAPGEGIIFADTVLDVMLMRDPGWERHEFRAYWIYRMPDDPIQPPMLLLFMTPRSQGSDSSLAIIACFRAKYLGS